MSETSEKLEIPGEYIYEGMPIGENVFPKEVLDKIRFHFQVRSDDVMIVGYPKSGTTWLQEIVWLIMNDVNTDAANQRGVWDRIPLIEQKAPGEEAKLDIINRMTSPRLYKTHLPQWFMGKEIKEKQNKCIIIMRNPKDMLVSYYYFAQMRHPTVIKSWNQWFDKFQHGSLQFGDWWDHVIGWWTMGRRQPNFLFLTYEDVKVDTRGTVQKICTFLDTQLDPGLVDAILEHTSFKNMQTNPATNLQDKGHFICQAKSQFIRKGVIGDWKNYFTPAQSAYVDKLYAEKLVSIGLPFQFE